MQFCTKVVHGKSWRHRTRLVLHGGCKMTFSSTGSWCGNPCPICKNTLSVTVFCQSTSFDIFQPVELKLPFLSSSYIDIIIIKCTLIFLSCCFFPVCFQVKMLLQFPNTHHNAIAISLTVNTQNADTDCL